MVSTLIVGGGIGGLSLARELVMRGLPVTILEKTARIVPIGAGIIMNPNAMRVLERNGLAEALRADAWPYLVREICDAGGRSLAVRDYQPLYRSGRLSEGGLVHRAHLLDVLYRGLPQDTVRFGAALKSIDCGGERVRVETERGEVFGADLLVGADGIRSQVRRQVFGEVAPLYLGYRSHRLVVANEGVRHFTEFLGRGQRIGLVPLSEARLYVWTTFNSPYDRPAVFESADEFREMFRQFTDSRIRRAFSQIKSPDEIISTDVEEIRLDRWTRDNVALLGDAAHAMTPNIGQGAGMAMEDAAVLAGELELVRGGAQGLPQALANYAKRRLPRVELIMRTSREVGDDGQRDGRLHCWLRNRRIRRAGRNAERMQEDLARLLDIAS